MDDAAVGQHPGLVGGPVLGAAHSSVTAPLAIIHGISPTSVADVAIRQTSPSAHGYTSGVTSVLSCSTVPLRSMFRPSIA